MQLSISGLAPGVALSFDWERNDPYAVAAPTRGGGLTSYLLFSALTGWRFRESVGAKPSKRSLKKVELKELSSEFTLKQQPSQCSFRRRLSPSVTAGLSCEGRNDSRMRHYRAWKRHRLELPHCGEPSAKGQPGELEFADSVLDRSARRDTGRGSINILRKPQPLRIDGLIRPCWQTLSPSKTITSSANP